MTKNKQWVLASHPDGMPSTDNWTLVERNLPEISEGQVQAKSIYLSVDPYMRGRISKASNYAAGVGIGDVMHGGGVGQVIATKSPDFAIGDIVETIGFGWQEYAALNANGLTKVDPDLGPIHSYLGYLGLPGLTAQIALDTIGDPKAGDTVVISAASGAVGQIAGQICKQKGTRVIAVASSQEKIDYCKSLGFDDGINYRSESDLDGAMKAMCPGGVDVFFDNTAGPIHDAVMKNLALGARIIICGTISLASKFDEVDTGIRFMRQILVARAKMQGFLYFDHLDKIDAARKAMSALEKTGKIKHREDILHGIDQMPTAFLRLLTGENFGKQLVQTSSDPYIES